ncbi:glycosyltransferase family 4 protein [Candidatus Woesearchaeota archaeon]|nr:glycosyltransferase family 4 protein [Candidatus Woesearchaeota archaeon]
MNLLFVLENYFPHVGGVEVVFKNLTEGLVKKGNKVSVVTHRLKGTKKFETINGVKIFRVNCFHSRYFFTFFSIPKVLKLAKKADIIHTTIFNGAFPAWLASKIVNKKAILSVHEVWVGKWKELTELGKVSSFIHEILERLIYFLKFDKYIVISQSTQRQLINQGIKKDKIKVVYCGLDYNHWNPKKYDSKKIRRKLDLEKKFVYLFYGRPGVSKGLRYLIKAVPLISKNIPNSKLVAIVSKDKTYIKRYKEILRLIKNLGIQKNIVLIDPVSYKELPNYIKAADCVVVPSLAEGFGFCAAEACAMEKPVVASDTTSLPEVVSGKYVLVKPRNPEEIAKGVEDVFRFKTKQSRLKRFELKDNINGYLGVYKEILR